MEIQLEQKPSKKHKYRYEKIAKTINSYVATVPKMEGVDALGDSLLSGRHVYF